MSPFIYGNISYGATTLKFPPFGNIFFDAIRVTTDALTMQDSVRIISKQLK